MNTENFFIGERRGVWKFGILEQAAAEWGVPKGSEKNSPAQQQLESKRMVKKQTKINDVCKTSQKKCSALANLVGIPNNILMQIANGGNVNQLPYDIGMRRHEKLPPTSTAQFNDFSGDLDLFATGKTLSRKEFPKPTNFLAKKAVESVIGEKYTNLNCTKWTERILKGTLHNIVDQVNYNVKTGQFLTPHNKISPHQVSLIQEGDALIINRPWSSTGAHEGICVGRRRGNILLASHDGFGTTKIEEINPLSDGDGQVYRVKRVA